MTLAVLMEKSTPRWWRYRRVLLVPVLLWGLVAITLWEPLSEWLKGGEVYDENVLKEWLEESRGFRTTLPAMLEQYVESMRELPELKLRQTQAQNRIRKKLLNLGQKARNRTDGQFPHVQRLEILFNDEQELNVFTWSASTSHDPFPLVHLEYRLTVHSRLRLFYQPHLPTSQQERTEPKRWVWLLLPRKLKQTFDSLPGLIALMNWLEEVREAPNGLSALLNDYADVKQRLGLLEYHQKLEREKILEHLRSMGEPAKMYSGQLPLFPNIYSVDIRFNKKLHLEPITWSSKIPSDETQRQELRHKLSPNSSVRLFYRLHAFSKQQRDKDEKARRASTLSIFVILVTGLASAWMVYQQRRDSEHEQEQARAQHQADQAEIRRQEAERKQEEAERDLLQERLTAQMSERQLLEMKSQLYASIGIMAGSYAHNIKNLLVRPNDLLQRCLEAKELTEEQANRLQEVRATLRTVTERLQLILRTVRRDPSQSELEEMDLGEILRDLDRTWKQMAWEKWKLSLSLELEEGALLVHADRSHLQQAIENLLFNARDATFDMRNHLREDARRQNNNGNAQREAIIAAAAWKGEVQVRAWNEPAGVVFEVQDNGVGMDEEVRAHCTETHFSTKRNDATYEGHGAGMGLGLSFVTVILEHHSAELEIDSEPLKGTTFRIRFPREQVKTEG